MTATSRTVTVRIADLLRDRRFQVRAKLDPGTVDRYAAVYASGNPMPPVKVAMVHGAGIVVDGWHRIAALEKLGIRVVEAETVETTEREAYWLAAKANLSHGLPLKSRELRQAFRHYVRARKHREGGRLKSYREIAQNLGGMKTHPTIRNWMMQDFPKVFAEMAGGDDFKGTGGHREAEPQGTFQDTAKAALQTALAAYRGVTDAGARGALIELCAGVLSEMKRGGHWEPNDF